MKVIQQSTDHEVWKALAKVLANPVDLLQLKCRVDSIQKEFGNCQLEIKDNCIYGIVEDNQKVLILGGNETYHNLQKVINEQ